MLIHADISITRLGGNLFPLTLQDEIDGRDFILASSGPFRTIGCRGP
jgi:hypothetical protein